MNPPPIDPQGQMSNTGYNPQMNPNAPYPAPTPPGTYPNAQPYGNNPVTPIPPVPNAPPYGQLDPASQQVINPYAPTMYGGYPAGGGVPPVSPAPEQRNKGSKWLIFLIVGIVLLLIISSFVIGGVVNNTIAANNANATATAQVLRDQLATTTAQAQATATVQADPYQPAGTLAWLDPLSQPNKWQVQSNPDWGGQCQFVNSAYQVSQSTLKRLFVCDGSSTYSSFAFEVNMKIKLGDCGGLKLRGDNNNTNLYVFEICQDGSYNFTKYTSNTASTTLTKGNTPAIHKGTDQLNVIATVANGSNFDLYINQQKIETVSDSSYSQGFIGFIADAYQNATSVTYQNARLWTIS